MEIRLNKKLYIVGLLALHPFNLIDKIISFLRLLIPRKLSKNLTLNVEGPKEDDNKNNEK